MSRNCSARENLKGCMKVTSCTVTVRNIRGYKGYKVFDQPTFSFCKPFSIIEFDVLSFYVVCFVEFFGNGRFVYSLFFAVKCLKQGVLRLVMMVRGGNYQRK